MTKRRRPPHETPASVFVRATTHLRMVRIGLRDMEDSDPNRVIIGCFSVAVFGRSVTLALQCRAGWDKAAFDEWYAPWQVDMEQEPLCKFFYILRTDILHDLVPVGDIVTESSGPSAPPQGTVIFIRRPLPAKHRGRPIADSSTFNLCRLYLAYLDEMVDSASEVIAAVHKRWWDVRFAASSDRERQRHRSFRRLE